MMIVYIASALSSPDMDERQRNVDRAMAAAWDVAQRGHQPLVPHLTHYLDLFWAELAETVPYETWLAWALELVKRSDAVLRLPGESPGAVREVMLAMDLGLPVFYDVEDLPRG